MFSVTTPDPEVSAARCGLLTTAHGTVETPVFMPVATMGTVKMLPTADLRSLGAEMFIANAFLLSLRPGLDILRGAGGLHGFMNWDRSIFTDSGGFQMLRRDFLQKVTDEGVLLKSPYDGQNHLYTPERVVSIQQAVGSDVAMILDDVPHFGITQDETVESVRRTKLWAERAQTVLSTSDTEPADANGERSAPVNPDQAFFAITQGGFFEELRERSTRDLAALDFDGYGIGGLCIGEPKETMYRMLDVTMPFLPESKPRYLMGVGSPRDVIDCVGRGIDIFDSVFPTRNARHGAFFTHDGTRINLRARHDHDGGPLDERCACPVCQHYSRSYLYHLRKSKEFIWKTLLTIHNLWFMLRLMERIRTAIREGEFTRFRASFHRTDVSD